MGTVAKCVLAAMRQYRDSLHGNVWICSRLRVVISGSSSAPESNGTWDLYAGVEEEPIATGPRQWDADGGRFEAYVVGGWVPYLTHDRVNWVIVGSIRGRTFWRWIGPAWNASPEGTYTPLSPGNGSCRVQAGSSDPTWWDGR